MNTTPNHSYDPRPSTHVARDIAQSDGDVWQERITVCERPAQDGDFVLRSYYRNARTHQRVWDEPPSGASQIVHATPSMRQHAEAQRAELQLTLSALPSTKNEETTAQKKGFFARFRNRNANNSNNSHKKDRDESKDLQLQKAIALSLADQVQFQQQNTE